MKKSNVGSSILNKEINVEDYFFFLKAAQVVEKNDQELKEKLLSHSFQCPCSEDHLAFHETDYGRFIFMAFFKSGRS